jgi:hypothetical protein
MGKAEAALGPMEPGLEKNSALLPGLGESPRIFCSPFSLREKGVRGMRVF